MDGEQPSNQIQTDSPTHQQTLHQSRPLVLFPPRLLPPKWYQTIVALHRQWRHIIIKRHKRAARARTAQPTPSTSTKRNGLGSHPPQPLPLTKDIEVEAVISYCSAWDATKRTRRIKRQWRSAEIGVPTPTPHPADVRADLLRLKITRRPTIPLSWGETKTDQSQTVSPICRSSSISSWELAGGHNLRRIQQDAKTSNSRATELQIAVKHSHICPLSHPPPLLIIYIHRFSNY